MQKNLNLTEDQEAFMKAFEKILHKKGLLHKDVQERMKVKVCALTGFKRATHKASFFDHLENFFSVVPCTKKEKGELIYLGLLAIAPSSVQCFLRLLKLESESSDN